MRSNTVSLVCSFLAVTVLIAISSCRPASEKPATTKTSEPAHISGPPPFKTREPDRYQAVRTITITNSSGEKTETKSVIARDGLNRREETTDASGRQWVQLQNSEGSFLIAPNEKLFADLNASRSPKTTTPENLDDEVSPQQFLHSDTPVNTYQTMGDETVNGRAATKYQVTVNDAASSNVTNSETTVWVDGQLGMPVKTEMTSKTGSRYTMQLSDIKLEVERKLFEIPKAYKKVPLSEIRHDANSKN